MLTIEEIENVQHILELETMCNWDAIKTAIQGLDELLKYKKLEEELGCPLDLVLIPYFMSGLKKVWYHNQWCDVVRVVAYEEATTPYMEVRCKDYDYLKFIPLTNYKKAFWLKEDKSE